MITWGQLLGFAVVSIVIIVVPGPGVLFVVGRALSHGRRTALATACGHAAGNYLVAVFVSVGLGALLERSDQVFLAVKLAGAAYLAWLGIHAVRHRDSLATAISDAGAAVPRDGWRALRDGAVVGVTNPKAYILFGALLPQFVHPGAGHVPVQMLLLAAVSVCLGAVSDCAWGLAASGVRAWFARSPRRFALVGGAGGLAMIAVGVSVALTGRKDLRGCPLAFAVSAVQATEIATIKHSGGDRHVAEESLAVLPIQGSRKSRCRSAARNWRRPSCLGGFCSRVIGYVADGIDDALVRPRFREAGARGPA